MKDGEHMTRSHALIDDAALGKLRRIAGAALSARRPDAAVQALPDEVAFKLTNRCNLRCAHCYQWSEDGYHQDFDHATCNTELDIAVVAKVLDATRDLASNVFVWGGEPLVYRHWDAFVELLAEHRRWTAICTNGVLIERRIESLLRISKRLEMFIALDGFEHEHEALRGKGSFTRAHRGLRRLVEEKEHGRFLGEITVNCVYQDSMVGQLFDFVSYLEDQGVDAVYLSLPWHISPETAQLMDEYVATRFPDMTLQGKGSWHSYTFTLSPGVVNALRADLARIAGAEWRIKIRYNPKVEEAELEEFLRGSHRPAGGKSRCLALRSRMEVFPSGDAGSCHLFPEFLMGDLKQFEVADVWHGQVYERMRETVHQCGLMPVCAKCNLLYSRGI
jgi:sulfatase maturation enzyme AslB (radical SAM superfamily)